ncbi:MAG: HAD family phosphatase [Clostridia bacterium]|nr:HAD family phosphatase [Clostridia bacterium]
MRRIVKLVISDADGTLLHRGKLIDERTFGRMLTALGTRSIPMVIASGRTYPELKSLFSPYENRLVFFALDGAVAIAGGQRLCAFPLSLAAVADVLALLSVSGIRGAEFCTRDTVYLYARDEALAVSEEARLGDALRVLRYRADKEASPLPGEATAIPDEPVYKIVIYKKRGAEPFLLPTGTRAVYESPVVTELVRADVSKRRAAEVVCGALHTEPCNLLVYGDGENDRELLLWAAESGGRAVTVYGAKHELFSVTRYHTGNVADSVLYFLSEDDREAKKAEEDRKRTERIAKYKNHG